MTFLIRVIFRKWICVFSVAALGLIWGVESYPLLDEADSIGQWSSLALNTDPAFVKSGKASACWKNANVNSFPAPREVPLDWSPYNAIAFWVYSEVNNGAQIAIAVGTSNRGVGDCYLKTLTIEWQGWHEVILPFSEFRRSGNPKGWNSITWMYLNSGGWGLTPKSDTVLYFDSMRLTADTVLTSSNDSPWKVSFSCNRPRTAIFEKGSPIQLTFSSPGNQGGANSLAVKALWVRINDYFDRVVTNAEIQGTPSGQTQKFTLDFPSLPPGHYEIQAWALDANGRKLWPNSCIASTGSQPRGKATFAVMPRTIAENHARSARLGEQAFFGLHGGYADLSDSLGVTWQLLGNRWRSREPVRPDPLKGSPWVSNALSQPPEPAWNYNLMNLAVNLDDVNPDWALTNDPALFPWKDFESYFRKEVAVEKYRFPHQKSRLYDVTWEINLDHPEMKVRNKVYRSSDVVDIYRRMHPFLQQVEPGAKLLGPCASGMSAYRWTEELFQLGIGKYLDGFNFHGYTAPPPEKSRFPEEIRRLRQLIKNNNDGKDLDMYCSELGYRSLYGSTDRSREHAQWHVRTAIILKGEGVKVYFPFYGFDYLNDQGSWGLTYNLDPARSFRPPAVLPKVAAPALAVCVDQIEGMAPLSDLPWFGSDIYGYFFRSGPEITLAVWSVDASQKIKLPMGNEMPSLELVDMMGGKSSVKVERGAVQIALSPSPVYLLHLPVSLYGSGVSAPQVAVSSFPGPKENPTGESGLFLLAGSDASRPARWLVVKSPFEIAEVGPSFTNRQKNIEIKIANRGDASIPVDLTVDSPVTGVVKQLVNLPAAATSSVFLPLADYDSGKAVTFNITAKSGNSPSVNVSKKINFLSAHRPGQVASPHLLPNTVKWQGVGSSGQTQAARVDLEWDEKNLYVAVETDDQEHRQTNRDAFIWKGDGLQIVFDTHPESDEVYNSMAGIFTKKITGLDFALTENGEVVAWRHDTHSAHELPSGALAPHAVKAEITRNESRHQTVYRLTIPWKEIGLDRVTTGKSIGIDLLVNDLDTGNERRGIELFGAIMTGGIQRNYARFGSFVLQ